MSISPRILLAGAVGFLVAAAVCVHLSPNTASGGTGTAAIVCMLLSILLIVLAAFRFGGGSRLRRLCIAAGAAVIWSGFVLMAIGLVTLLSGQGPE